MKSSWFKDKDLYEIAKELDTAASIRGQHLWRVLDDWLSVIFYEMNAAVEVKTIDPQYEQLVNKYKKGFDNLSTALGLLIMVYTKSSEAGVYRDVLGDFYGSLQALNKNFGQFFTPYHLCILMAELSLPTEFDKDKPLLINEPTCGAGGTVIAATQILRSRGAKNNEYSFVMQDIDLKCVMMSYIQTTLYDIPAQIIWGDTLALEEKRVYDTFAYKREYGFKNIFN